MANATIPFEIILWTILATEFALTKKYCQQIVIQKCCSNIAMRSSVRTAAYHFNICTIHFKCCYKNPKQNILHRVWLVNSYLSCIKYIRTDWHTIYPTCRNREIFTGQKGYSQNRRTAEGCCPLCKKPLFSTNKNEKKKEQAKPIDAYQLNVLL